MEFEAAKAALDALWDEYVEEAKEHELDVHISSEVRMQDFFLYHKEVEETNPATWVGEFSLERAGEDATIVTLSICMQHDLGKYIEPIEGQPETYETEQRHFIVSQSQLQELVAKAEKQAEKYRRSVEECIVFARREVSYATMHLIVTGEPSSMYSNNVYEADEDLMFLYERLHALHRFIFEVKTGGYLDGSD